MCAYTVCTCFDCENDIHLSSCVVLYFQVFECCRQGGCSEWIKAEVIPTNHDNVAIWSNITITMGTPKMLSPSKGTFRDILMEFTFLDIRVGFWTMWISWTFIHWKLNKWNHCDYIYYILLYRYYTTIDWEITLYVDFI